MKRPSAAVQKDRSLLSRQRKRARIAAKEKRTHNFCLQGHRILRMEELFWKLMIYRQCCSIRRRDPSIQQSPPFGHEKFLGRTISSWVADYDFEEPVCNNSLWHQRRVQYIKDLAEIGSAATKGVPSGVILLTITLFVFFTASDGMLNWLQEKVATIQWNLLASGSTKNLVTIFGDVLKIPTQPFHKRDSPQKIHANTWHLAIRSDAVLLDEEPNSEDEIADAKKIRPPAGAAAAAQALRHTCFCRLAKKNLPSIKRFWNIRSASCKFEGGRREKAIRGVQWKAPAMHWKT